MITQSRYRSVVRTVRDVVADHLRVAGVVSEDGEGFHEDLFFIRDDVADDYTSSAIEAIGAEMLFELWNREYQGELFAAGPMRYAFHRYDDAVIVMCHDDGGDGVGDFAVVVSIDADTPAPIDAVADAVCAGLHGDGSPSDRSKD
jgi:hypothetical protein